jgi:hypothetical protein
MRREQIDIADFNKYFRYDPATGEFIRIKAIGKVKPTSRVGSVANGYLVIGFKHKYYLAHRLAWRLYYGKWPDHGLDHINGDKLDNRIANLRDVDQRANTSNRHYHREGKLVGATFWKAKNLWRSRITIAGINYDLGCFKTEAMAHEQYLRCLNSKDKMDFIKNKKQHKLEIDQAYLRECYATKLTSSDFCQEYGG